MIRLLPFLVLGILAGPVKGIDVQWTSSAFATNLDSENSPLTGDWSFYLGYFGAGFNPSSANTAQWSANWVTVDAARFFETGTRFSSKWANDGLSTGKSAWIWGVKRQDTDNEWILMRGPSWVFPFPGGITPPLTWSVNDATAVIVGTVNSGGVHIRTAQVTGEPPVLSYAMWQRENFTAAEIEGGILATADADPDGDGVANSLEFALASNPRLPASRPQISHSRNPSGLLIFATARTRNASVALTGEVSADLIAWKDGPAFVQLIFTTPLSIAFQDVPGGTKRFGRIRVTIP